MTKKIDHPEFSRYLFPEETGYLLYHYSSGTPGIKSRAAHRDIAMSILADEHHRVLDWLPFIVEYSQNLAAGCL